MFPLLGNLQVDQVTQCGVYREGLGRSHTDSLVDSDSVNSYELTLVVSVGIHMMPFIPVAHTILPSPLQQDFSESQTLRL